MITGKSTARMVITMGMITDTDITGMDITMLATAKG